ncbi:hypothetical protein [Ramlibacter sp. WS9]|uniref:hypothetical protein n=1 Tax=Ramlibacter sp. WS9 TaxID=1882741 RepID=UPI0011429642|nr:hypothetical protein [Ramlibacter sp. WS9]
MRKKFGACFALAFALCGHAWADAGPFACGKFGANVTNSASADLGMTATAMFATPGYPVPVNFLEQGPWFLLDDFGSGPLMGCQPATSRLGGGAYTLLNSYNASGMLAQQVVKQAGEPPVTLKFRYVPGNPYRVAYAEQLCFLGVAGSPVYRLTFSYSSATGQLSQLGVSQDAACPDAAGTYTFAYGSTAVPNLPSQVDFVDGQGNKQSWQYGYQVGGGLLQRVDLGAGNNIGYSYGGTLLKQMTLNASGQSTPQVMGYTPNLQWAGYRTPPQNWGLTVTYQNGKPTSALQNTGCAPGECPPSLFTYTAAGARGGSIQRRLAANAARTR